MRSDVPTSPIANHITFFFQAEDGIRDKLVTGVQTCALPISGETTSAPRVGDGLIRLDASGKVTYASPNAQSAYRRLGFSAHLVGEELSVLFSRVAADPLEGTDAAERIIAALRGESPARKEVE